MKIALAICAASLVYTVMTAGVVAEIIGRIDVALFGQIARALH